MQKTALYFGSFNPLHYGHLAIAEYVINHCDIERFVMILSPHNPFKDSSILQEPSVRLKNLQDAIKRFNKEHKFPSGKRVEVSDIEFHLQEPLYTFNTLNEFAKQNPNDKLYIVVGADSMKSLPKWYRGEEILKGYDIIVYPRRGYRVKTLCRRYKALYLEDAPLNDISSTEIRQRT